MYIRPLKVETCKSTRRNAKIQRNKAKRFGGLFSTHLYFLWTFFCVYMRSLVLLSLGFGEERWKRANCGGADMCAHKGRKRQRKQWRRALSVYMRMIGFSHTQDDCFDFFRFTTKCCLPTTCRVSRQGPVHTDTRRLHRFTTASRKLHRFTAAFRKLHRFTTAFRNLHRFIIRK